MRNLNWILCLLLTFTAAKGYKYFQTKIPNGESVPHPCKPNYLWQGVGHMNIAGGGQRNSFGQDFHDAGKTWTQALCEKDSDNDGKTNGQELGDPNCVWTEGSAPEITVGLSHPGVCEPFDSELCRGRNDWVDCTLQEFKCDALERERPEDLMNVTVKFPPTQVPSKETSYYCMTFDLNLNEEYHMIATEPIIDNAHVMHHIVLYGCGAEVTSNEYTSPRECGMGLDGCYSIIGLWTVGTFGECFHQQIGFLMGGSGFRRVAMQFHWNNPQFLTDYTDSSGIVLHLTKNKRTHNAGVLMVGQEYIQLPPGEDSVDVVGRCRSDMSRAYLTGPVQFTRGINHMHYLGRAMKIEQFRDGVKLRDVTLDVVYSYDSPVLYDYLDTIEFLPGDEIRTTCTFKTKDRSMTVFKGDGTNDEMCYGFLTFHPVENMLFPYCTEWRGLDAMQFYYKDVINGCAWKNFTNTSIPEIQALHTKVLSHCSHLGLCLKECIDVIKEVKQHPCMAGDMQERFRQGVRQDAGHYMHMALFFSAIDSCDAEIAKESCPKSPTVTGDSPISRFSLALTAVSLLFVLIV